MSDKFYGCGTRNMTSSPSCAGDHLCGSCTRKLIAEVERLQQIERQHEELRAAAREIDKNGMADPDFWDDNEVIEISVVLLKNLRNVLEEQKRGEP